MCMTQINYGSFLYSRLFTGPGRSGDCPFIVALDTAVSKPGNGSLPEDAVMFMFLAGKAGRQS